jgi:hypothetical protein
MTLTDQIRAALNGEKPRRKRGRRTAAAEVEGEQAMPLVSDDEAAEAARLEAEEEARLFEQRANAAAEMAALARRRQSEEIRAARELLERADPQLLAEERYRAAVRGVKLYDTLAPPPGPSFAGQSPQNQALLEAKQRSAEAAWENEQNARKRFIDDQAHVIEALCAGQEPSQQAAIRAQFKAMKG